MSVPDYRNGKNVGEEEIKYDAYNDTGAKISAGDLFFLSYLRDADSLNTPARPTLDAVTSGGGVYRKVVVALEDIADATWGVFQYKGYCPKIKCAAGVATDHFLQGTTASTQAADDGTTQTVDSFAVTVEAVSATETGFVGAILFGERVLFTT
jgi:hypothetical protein